MTVIWHDVECGAYEADLPLWEELAAAAGGPVLDLGCGTGRVGLHLARREHSVRGVDLDPEIVAAFNERAAGLPAEAEVADVRDFSIGPPVALVLAPMQLLQLLSAPTERIACLSCIAAQLSPGGSVALAIAEDVVEGGGDGEENLPDTREVDGWVYSSLPLETSVAGGEIRVRRLRQTVSPRGELSDELEESRLCVLSARTLEREAEAAGLRALARRSVPPTEAHVGSTVVVLESGS